MIATLPDILTDNNKQQVTTDCLALVEQRLDDTTGLSGAGLKLAHKAVVAFAPGYYQSIVEQLIPLMLERLQPITRSKSELPALSVPSHCFWTSALPST